MADSAGLDLERYRPLIEQALAHTNGFDTWEKLAEEVEAGRAFLMVSPSGKTVAVLQPVHALHVWTASGDMSELMEMEADATQRAMAANFDTMTINGREGWQRVLAPLGWKKQLGLVKEL